MNEARHYRLGTNGSHIRDLQRRLNELGYPVSMDGVFDHATLEVLERVEEDFGLLADSSSFCVDPHTLRFLLDRGKRKPSVMLPVGKGMVLRDMSHAISAEDLVREVQRANIRWLAIQGLSQNSGSEFTMKPRHPWMTALTEIKCNVWVLATPLPGTHKGFVEGLIQVVDSWGAAGAIIDLKRSFMNRENEAFQLAEELQQVGFPVGISSSGIPAGQPEFPLFAFRDLDFGVPQIFDAGKTRQGETYLESCLDLWKSLLGNEIVIPMISAFSNNKVLEELSKQASRNGSTMVWWDWLTANQQLERWNIIRETGL